LRPIIILIRFVVYSNIFVAICSVALTHLSYILLDISRVNEEPVLLFVFCATYFVYNMQRIVRLRYSKLIGKNIGVRLSWMVRNRAFLLTSSLFMILVGGLSLLSLNQRSLLLIAPLAILSVLYVVPFIPAQEKKISLRKWPFLKVFIIALVWTFVTVMIPYVDEYGFVNFTSSNFRLTLITRFLFVLAITLPFDIRDLSADYDNHLKTIPAVIGKKATVVVSEILLLVYWGVKFYQFYALNQLSLAQFIALSISMILIMIIIAFAVKKRPELYYSGIVEGTMLILHFGVLVLEY